MNKATRNFILIIQALIIFAILLFGGIACWYIHKNKSNPNIEHSTWNNNTISSSANASSRAYSRASVIELPAITVSSILTCPSYIDDKLHPDCVIFEYEDLTNGEEGKALTEMHSKLQFDIKN